MAADLWVAVNFSPRQLPDLVEQVTQSLAVSGVPATAVHLEITESAVNDLEPVLTSLESLRAAGVALAVDDFGTGDLSLSYLKRLPVTSVKIDRSFVRAWAVRMTPSTAPSWTPSSGWLNHCTSMRSRKVWRTPSSCRPCGRWGPSTRKVSSGHLRCRPTRSRPGSRTSHSLVPTRRGWVRLPNMR